MPRRSLGRIVRRVIPRSYAMSAAVWVVLFWVLFVVVSHFFHVPLAPRVGQPGRLEDLERYAPLVPQDLPLYNITVATCSPRSGCALPRVLDDQAGPWVRVDRPLSGPTARKLGIWNGFGRPWYGRFVFYRRALRPDSARIVDVRVSQPEKRPLGPDWERVREALVPHRAHRAAVYLYVRIAPAGAPDVGVTELSVHYGHHTPLPGFVSAGTMVPAHKLHSHKAKVTLLMRHGLGPQVPRPTLRFRPDGTFKILQVADLHFSVLEEPCRDVADRESCQSHNHTMARIEQWLDVERPDLVAFTGDQWNGQGTSWDERSTTPIWIEPLVRRKIPWIPVFGNHDSESGFYSRTEQMQFLAQLPYSLAQVGPSALHGVGNFEVPVYAATNDIEVWTLWALDSGANAPASLWRPWQSALYDWIRDDQIEWLLRTMRAKPIAHRGGYETRPPGLLFVHIPLPEAWDAPDRDGDHVWVVGTRQERAGRVGGQLHRGIFDAVQRAQDAETPGIRVYVHGHMHNNGDCRRVRGTWICFGGGASYAAYGRLGLARRVRVYEMRDHGASLHTWQRTDDGERVDDMALRDATRSQGPPPS